jgi:hypothetical protein
MSADGVGQGPSNREAVAAYDPPQGCIQDTVGYHLTRVRGWFGFAFINGSFSNQLISHAVASPQRWYQHGEMRKPPL